MIRIAALLFALLYVAYPAHAQTEVSPPASAATPAKSTAKPATKSPAKPSKPKATAKQAAPTETGPCRLGVLAALGNQFLVKKIGLMVFGNEQAEVPVDSWGLDDLVVARVRAAVPGGAVRRIASAADSFAFDAPHGGVLFGTPGKISDLVRQAAGSANCGRYVLVTRSSSRVGSSQTIGGVGILQGSDFRSTTYLFALSYIRVFDGQTFTVLKEGLAVNDDQPALSRILLGGIQGPNRQLDKEAFPRPAPEAVHDVSLRDGVRSLLTTSLDKTLPALLGR